MRVFLVTKISINNSCLSAFVYKTNFIHYLKTVQQSMVMTLQKRNIQSIQQPLIIVGGRKKTQRERKLFYTKQIEKSAVCAGG
jgi:hypothetical protein